MRDAGESSREIAGVLARFSENGGKGDVERSDFPPSQVQARFCFSSYKMRLKDTSCLQEWGLSSPLCFWRDEGPEWQVGLHR